MAWITPKINWLATETIEAADFNRIESNILEARNYLVSIQYSVPTLTTTTGRNNTSIDFLSSINRIEANLEAVRTNFLTPAGYGAAKTWVLGKGFDYTDANRLENNTKLLYEFGQLAYQNFRYCGTQTCGGNWGLIY